MAPPTRASRKRAGDSAAPATPATPKKKLKSEASRDTQPRQTRQQTTRGKGQGAEGTGRSTPKAAKGAAREPGSSPAPTTPKGTVLQRKPTLFDDLDSALIKAETDHRRQLLGLDDEDDDDDADDGNDSGTSLSSMSDVDFEDVPLAQEKKDKETDDRVSDADSDEDAVFEDVATPGAVFSLARMAALGDDADGGGGGSSGSPGGGDLELTLRKDTRVSLTNPFGEKKGPSKMERLVRTATHCVHVQALLWHNAVRNAWLCDPEVQGLVLSHLPPRLFDEVDRWRRVGGGGGGRNKDAAADAAQAAEAQKRKRPKARGPGSQETKGKRGAQKPRAAAPAAARVEQGAVDLTHGDPLFRLLRVLAAWWCQAFRVTAPGLRKRGYLSLERLDRFLAAAKATGGRGDTARFGEQIRNLAAFRRHAQTLTGSRDVGAQLFTALLRALGLEARMVASLQPLGFGWNKLEDADPEKEEGEGEGEGEKDKAAPSPQAQPAAAKATAPRAAKLGSRTNAVLIRDDSDEEGTDGLVLEEVNSDNEAVVVLPPDATPTRPSRKRGEAAAAGSGYDRDLAYPHYWTEVLSPATNTFVPVDALVKRVVAQNRELVETLEPRGGKADQARQVLAYVVGYAADGTAKDVTVRYLKRQMLPGRTRGVRLPPEKVPVYDRRGKTVLRHDTVDWFRQAALRGYVRGLRDAHPLTEVDAAEDRTDLRPAQPETKPVRAGEETLQYYKQSAEFVLARHLKREEALVAGAVPVRVFRNGKTKGKGGGGDDDDGEKVYLRKDVVAVKSAETWHKQGRAPVAGAVPLKHVPYRAATLNRKREIAEAEAATGAPVLQGLYSYAQTDWIIPAPIRDGVIPKNAYGNIDLFAQHMLPAGAAHVPFRGAVRVCRRLGVDFAEAVVDFEFGHRMAVPVIQGVVVAAEHHDRVMAELARDEAERTRKADEKRRATVLGLWRKMLMGLRIVQRIRQDHGEVREDERVFGPRGHAVDMGEDLGEDMGEAGAAEEGGGAATSSFFPVEDEEDDEADHADDDVAATGGGFIVEDSRVT